MILPHSRIEKHILQENKKTIIIGVDEAGRGPLAGPVVAAAGWINSDFLEKNFKNKELIRDSKTLSEHQREKIFCQLSKDNNFENGVAIVDNIKIDEINILNATFLAMRLAVDDLIGKMLEKKLVKDNSKIIILVDGNQEIKTLKFKQRLFPQGDRNIFSIALASIFAKVSRDRIMNNFHKKYPKYGFDHHRGYGTREHFENIKKNGICPIHRKSFNLGLTVD